MIAQRIKIYGEDENEERFIRLLYDQNPICGAGRFSYQDIKFAMKITAFTS